MNNLFLSVLSIILFTSCNTRETEVYFIPTLHKLHKVNINYSYDSLQAIIGRLDPDIIAVEIRQDDIDRDTIFLSQFYPSEMWMMKTSFPKAEIKGFDWLGSEFEGKSLSDEVFETSEFTKIQKQLNKDSTYRSKIEMCQHRNKERLDFLKTATLQDIITKKTSNEIVTKYYACMKEQLKDTPYQYFSDFCVQRDEHILTNINKLVAENKGKCIVILAGDDHYQMLRNKLPHKTLY